MRFLDSKRSKWVILFFFILTGLWGGIVMTQASKKLKAASGSTDLLDIQPKESTADIYQYLEQVGSDGRAILKKIYHFHDFLFPLIYGGFYLLSIAYLIRRISKNKRWLLFLIVPLLMVVFDYIENFSILKLINAYPEKLVGLAGMLSAITLMKWSLGIVAGIILITSLIIHLIRKYRKKR